MPDYRVSLAVSDGPLDLLLYLIRHDEVGDTVKFGGWASLHRLRS